MKKNVAILYQSQVPPARDGIIKPMKLGGYSDSGADIAFVLQKNNVSVIEPIEHPEVLNDKDWVFPDNKEGIEAAISKGANTFWLNTVLYAGHPIEAFKNQGFQIVGQAPDKVEMYDDKVFTNALLRKNNLPIPNAKIIEVADIDPSEVPFSFPFILKPIRGRGSQGVQMVKNKEEFEIAMKGYFAEQTFGPAVYAEQYLAGEEITITVMPPGNYKIENATVQKENYWSLPPVKRFNHQNGIAPYNGTVAVIYNSAVLDEAEMQNEFVQQVCQDCEIAAALVDAKAPIRIDCRSDESGKFYLFDLNMKPNMTGASRLHRQDQDSLTAMAARKIGWNFDDLILNMLAQSWTL